MEEGSVHVGNDSSPAENGGGAAPLLTVDDSAREKIRELMAGEPGEALALRVGVEGRGPGGFQYNLQFVDAGERAADDVVVEAGGFQVYVDAASVEDLRGASIAYVENLPTPGYESGFRIDNPNPLWRDPRAAAVQEVLDGRINPGVAGHGGRVTLLDVRDDVAYIALGGGCQG
nr:iron-sulfur cluster assembly accessory protein [Gemmatimonadota bacterium]